MTTKTPKEKLISYLTKRKSATLSSICGAVGTGSKIALAALIADGTVVKLGSKYELAAKIVPAPQVGRYIPVEPPTVPTPMQARLGYHSVQSRRYLGCVKTSAELPKDAEQGDFAYTEDTGHIWEKTNEWRDATIHGAVTGLEPWREAEVPAVADRVPEYTKSIEEDPEGKFVALSPDKIAAGKEAIAALGRIQDKRQDKKDPLASFESRLGYTFKDRKWLIEALTHASTNSILPHDAMYTDGYESLEYVGDAVFGLIVRTIAFNTVSVTQEAMARMTDNVVTNRLLLRLAKKLRVGGVIIVQGGHNDKMLGDSMEAIMGAIYFDGGFAAAQTVVSELLRRR